MNLEYMENRKEIGLNMGIVCMYQLRNYNSNLNLRYGGYRSFVV